MLFLTYWFVFFAVTTLPAYWVVPPGRGKYLLLLVLCSFFHMHFAGPAGVAPIVLLGLLTYGAGRWRRQSACTLTMVLAVLTLIFYKYNHFVCINLIGALSPATGAALDKSLTALLPASPPLGISFFVFEFLHYLFEVRRGHPPITSLLDFAVFAIFWPSIVAGPVKRYREFLAQFTDGAPGSTAQDVAEGLLRIATGLVKKFTADTLSGAIDFWEPQFHTLDLGFRWTLLALISVRIWFDFAGYSDMAIGFARMLGIHLPENFNNPYFATSLRDFWQRWHISLSSWIRDYVYIPLGGNRGGNLARARNLLLAFALCGLWHGADWHFVVWGIYHGAGLAVAQIYMHAGRPGKTCERLLTRFPPLAWALTFVYVSVGWLLFFYPVDRATTLAQLLVRRS
jgi:alginate O-acetyltransferase complex protein AlgI